MAVVVDVATARKRRHSKGYVLVFVPGHPAAWADGWAYEHRVVFWNEVRPLRDDEVVHHINEVKDDNRKENLKPMKNRYHSRHHARQRYA